MGRKIRLAVGSPEAMHSSTWSIWTQGDELYAASLHQGVAKASIHSSGICRFAWLQEYAVPDPDHELMRDPTDPRIIDRWKIAAVGEEPWTICLQIIVPGIYIPERFTIEQTSLSATKRASLIWVSPPDIGHVRILLLVRARTAGQDISEFIAGDYEVVDKLQMRSGGVVWVVSHDEVLPPNGAVWQAEVSKLKIDFSNELTGHGGLLLSSLQSPAGKAPFPAIRDVALGPSNFRRVEHVDSQ